MAWVNRLEDKRFLNGTGCYAADLDFPDCLQACVLRSPHGHASIVSIDVEQATGSPGVVGVFTGADLESAGVGSLRNDPGTRNRDGSELMPPIWRLLALNTVRYVGDPVALVVADTEEAALDALEKIAVEYLPLPAKVSVSEAEVRCLDWEIGDRANTDTALEQAPIKVFSDIVNNRLMVTPMETRAAIGTYDPASERYTLYTPSQGVHFLRKLIAGPLLGVPEKQLRVVTHDVGGGFGMKFVAFPEQGLVLFAAKTLGRTVRWISTRSEAFVADTHARDHLARGELGLNEHGQLLALRINCAASLGAYVSSYGIGTITSSYTKMAGNVYRIPHIYVHVDGRLTHTAPTDAYRGAGTPEMVYLIERLIEQAAQASGIDRIELRRRNLITSAEYPYTTPVGRIYADGDFPAIFEEALRVAQWDTFAARRELARERGKLLGIGAAPYVKVTAAEPGESAAVVLRSEGHIEVHVGTQDSGQGHATSFALLVCERLGIGIEHVTVIQGDSDILPSGSGSGGSSSLVIDAETLISASDRFIEQARAMAADVLEAAVADVEYDLGRLSIVGTDRAIGLLELATHLSPGSSVGCIGEASFDGDDATYPNGAHVCEVEVDPDTGHTKIIRFVAVDDIGRVWHPQIAEGQVHGGVAQGIGQALYEHTVYESGTGQLLSGSLMDYCLPRADDLPMFVTSWKPTSASNEMGVKGIGEQGPVGAPPALINAIADAIGTHEIQMPATAEQVWRAIHAKARAGENNLKPTDSKAGYRSLPDPLRCGETLL